MNNIDWNKVKFRASSWGNLMTEPKTKEDKLAGKLSATAQKELIKIYSLLKYNRKKDITTNQMDKGKQAEPESIELFSRVENTPYIKNEDQLENEWFCGKPDIFTGPSIHKATMIWDIKSRWELETFMPKLAEDADKSDEYQLQCYYSLTGAKGGGIANTLVDCPLNILLDEQRRLLYSMNVATDENPEYKAAAAELERLLTFPDIDYRERVIKQPVVRDDEIIERMKAKVPVFREWLSNFEKKHLSQYPK